jgi:hypothetical protein
MGTRQENALSREAHVVKMEAQLDMWSTQLDELVAGCIRAGAHSNDAYVLRIEGLRTLHGAVQARLKQYAMPPGGGAWGTFHATIADDWKALEAGFKRLSRSEGP